MTRLPVLHHRPRTFAECRFLGAPAPKTSTAVAPARADDSEREDEDDEGGESDEPATQLDEQLDLDAAARAEQLREDGGVPCPFVGCSEHLAWVALGVQDPRALTEAELLEVLPRLEALDVDSMAITCTLRGPYTLEEIGSIFDLTRERIRQIEGNAFKRLRHPAQSHTFRGLCDEGHEVSRPDLVQRTTSIGLDRAQVNAAAARIVPEIAAESAKAVERVKRGGKRRANDAARCATEGCNNDRSSWARDVAAELLPLCGRCREAARKVHGLRVRRQPAKLYTVRGESLSLAQWGARLDCGERALRTTADRNERSYVDEVERRLALRDAAASAASPVAPAEPSAPATAPMPVPVADPLTHAATVHEVFAHVVTNAKPEPAPEMIEIDDVRLTLRGWGYYLDLKRPELQRIQQLASKGGPSLVDELARLLAVKRAGRKPVIAKPAPAPVATTARVFEQVFASAPAPAPTELTPALEPAAEQLTHDVDAPELEPETIAPPSIAPEAPVDASAPAAREDHVQTEPTITAAAPPKAAAAPRKRARKPEPKHAPARRISELDAFVRDAARGFSAIAARVGKGGR